MTPCQRGNAMGALLVFFKNLNNDRCSPASPNVSFSRETQDMTSVHVYIIVSSIIYSTGFMFLNNQKRNDFSALSFYVLIFCTPSCVADARAE